MSKPKGILGGHLNIRSILPKRDQIQHLLTDSNLDFLALSETWLNSNIQTSMIDVPGYICHRKDRTSKKGGGVLFYVRDTLKCNEIKLDTPLECLALNVVLSPKMNFNIIVLYNPPSYDVSFYENLDKIFKYVNTRTESVFLGDFNINWLEKSRRKKLKRLLSKHSLHQMIKGPTRITRASKTMIDLIVTNRPQRIIRTYNLLTGLSDHNMTMVVRKLTKQRLPKFTNESKQGNLGIPKIKLTQVKNDLDHLDWNNVLQSNDLENCCNSLMKNLTNLIGKYSKTFKGTQRKASLPWLNNDTRQLMKKRDYALKKALLSKTNTDFLIFKGLRNAVVRELRKAKTAYFMQLIEDSEGNSASLWKHLNSLTKLKPSQQKTIAELEVNGVISTNNSAIANELNNFFIQSVEELAKTFEPATLSQTTKSDQSDLFQIKEVSQEKVHTIINKLKKSKAKDVFGLDTSFITTHCSALIKPVTHLVNLSIRVGKFPQSWKQAIITPIFKAGAKNQASNYRPISILPAFSKILEKIIIEQLVEHLEGNKLINSKQFGFRAGYSTEMANCYLTENIKSKLDKGNVVGAVFIDLKKAFDTVNHNILLNKLTTFNFSEHAIGWFASYLEHREQRVKINTELSTSLQSTMGIPQGSILGPLLFSLYINDLPTCCQSANCQMYADDTVIYASARTPTIVAETLTKEMEGISQWLKENHLTLNFKKTVSMCFSIRGKIKCTIKIDQEAIEEVEELNFLGIILDHQLKFNTHINKLCKTVRTNLNCFRMIRHHIPVKAALLFFHAMILSHLSYCVTVWGQASQTTVKPIMSLYKQALKIMDQKPIMWHHCLIVQKYKLLNFESFIKFSFLKLIFKCINNQAPAVLCPFVTKINTRGVATRRAAGGNCIAEGRKTTFGHSSFSVIGTHFWNDLPTEIKTETNLKTFNRKVKHWLKENQICGH